MGMDLATHLLEKKGKPAGPTKGLKIAGRMAGIQAPLDSSESLATILEEVMGVLGDPDEELHGIKTLVHDRERLQSRKLSVADLE